MIQMKPLSEITSQLRNIATALRDVNRDLSKNRHVQVALKKLSRESVRLDSMVLPSSSTLLVFRELAVEVTTSRFAQPPFKLALYNGKQSRAWFTTEKSLAEITAKLENVLDAMRAVNAAAEYLSAGYVFSRDVREAFSRVVSEMLLSPIFEMAGSKAVMDVAASLQGESKS